MCAQLSPAGLPWAGSLGKDSGMGHVSTAWVWEGIQESLCLLGFLCCDALCPSCADTLFPTGKKPILESDTTHLSMVAFLDPTLVKNGILD